MASGMHIVLFGLNGRGGPLHYCSHLANALLDQDSIQDVRVLLPSYSNRSLFRKQVDIQPLYAPPNPALTFLATFFFWQHIQTIRAIRKAKPDLINILDIHPWYLLYLPFLKNIPLIVTINDPQLHSGEAGWLMTHVLRWLTRRLLARAKHIIVLGKKQQDVLQRMGYRQKEIFVSRIGSYASLGGKATIHPPKDPVILFFGRIKQYKGLDVLLEAFPLVKKKTPDAQLLIVGEGDLTPYKDRLAGQQGIEVINRFVKEKEIAGFFNRSAVIAMPYHDATQTGVVQIAYSFKRPVVATTVGSLPELVEDGKTGYLVPPGNVPKLTAALSSLLQDRAKLLKFGENAYIKLGKELDWQPIAAEITHYYQKVSAWNPQRPSKPITKSTSRS